MENSQNDLLRSLGPKLRELLSDLLNPSKGGERDPLGPGGLVVHTVDNHKFEVLVEQDEGSFSMLEEVERISKRGAYEAHSDGMTYYPFHRIAKVHMKFGPMPLD